jgi:Uma2 family endonuclease
MRVVLVDAPESLLEERRRLDMEKFDERWEGEWHFVNPPKSWHTRLNFDLGLVLGPRARHLGLEPFGDSTGVFADLETDWRIPDQVYVRPEQVVEEGVIGAELVVELYSPGDESYAKLPFYAARGITEAMIVQRDRRFELFRLDDAGAYQPVHDGRSTVLGVTFTTVAGPKLRIEWDGGSAEV